MLGQKLRELREAKGFVQREVAASLQVDTAYVSKMENNEKPVNKNHLIKLAKILSVPVEDLLPIWLADKILQAIEKESYQIEAINLVLNKLSDDES